jgi:hypothetical protein
MDAAPATARRPNRAHMQLPAKGLGAAARLPLARHVHVLLHHGAAALAG